MSESKGSGPRWLVGTAVGSGSVIGLLVIGWLSLPVENKGSDLTLRARPASFFSSEIHVTIANNTLHHLDRGTVNQDWPSKMVLLYTHQETDIAPREQVVEKVSLQPNSDTRSGLQTVQIFAGGEHSTASTEVWVINFNGKIWAIK